MAIVEVYECDECGVRSDQGPDDGLPEGWQANIDDLAFCPACLLKNPLDAHECDNDMCCYGRIAPTSQPSAAADDRRVSE